MSILSSRRLHQALPFVSVGLAIFVMAGIAYVGLRSPDSNEAQRAAPVVCGGNPRSTEEQTMAKRTIAEFVEYAVQRKNPVKSYDLVTQAFKQGLTREEWATGNIPVIPYGPPLTVAEVVEVRFNPQQIETVVLLGSRQEGRTLFFLDLVRTCAGWKVDYWAPAAPTGTPKAGVS